MLKTFFKVFIMLLAIVFLVLYFFVPSNTVELSQVPSNSNFTSNFAGSSQMQFYENMRFPSSDISYKIYDSCTIKKKDDMRRGFQIVEDATLLTFYPVSNNEQIMVTCNDKQETDGTLFIAGEGGPTNITKAGEFNVILAGKILLIRDSECSKPNVAIHELLHVLGFDHSLNTANIMYNISACSQEIGDDTINLINELYSIPSHPDLVLNKVSPKMHGKYLDVNMSIKNEGLKSAGSTRVKIYADDEFIEEIELESLDIGFGVKSISRNIFVGRTNIQTLKFDIETNYKELDKNNNVIVFEVKK